MRGHGGRGAMTFLDDQRPVRWVSANEHAPGDTELWPTSIPAVAQILGTGLDLPAGVTLLVGENGSGKSTIVEAVAMAYGLSPEGGVHERPALDVRDRVRPVALAPAGALAGRVPVGLFPARRDDARASTRTWPTTPARTRATPTSTGSVTGSRSSSCCGPASTRPASTASTSPRPHCPSRRRSRWSARSPTSPRVARRSCARPTRRSWLRFPARTSSRWATGVSARRRTGDLGLVSHWRRYLDEPMRYLRHVL